MKKINSVKRTTVLVFSFLLMNFCVLADNVDLAKARHVAAYFMSSEFGSKAITDKNIELVYQIDNDELGVPALYFFNTADGRGFVVVAGDESVSPIVAYSTNGSLDVTNLPPNMMYMMMGQAEVVKYAQSTFAEPERAVKAEWDELVNEELPYFGSSPKAIVQLMKSTWNQEGGYNNMCPVIDGSRSVTGCVATAMAQIMYYWRYPKVGSGVYTYTHSKAGELTANFGSTYYDYDKMVDDLTADGVTQENIDAVALLNYHCGISVSMNYGPTSSSSSEVVDDAYRKYFKYVRDSMSLVHRTDPLYNNTQSATTPNYRDTNWVNLIKSEILKNRPVYYSAHDNTSTDAHAGHAFVCSGWNSLKRQLYFNWGWGGNGDCYCSIYKINMLRPSGYKYIFQSSHTALVGLQPPADTLNAHVAIEKIDDNPFTAAVYPNPASDYVNIEYMLAGEMECTMEVFDVAGKKVESRVLSPLANNVRLSLENYKTGVYVCHLQGHTTKFVVKK